MARMNARMMRGKMALEVAAEIYSRHMFSLGNVVTVSIKPSSKEEQFPPICLGINGDVMGGLQAPIEVAKKRVDVGFVNPSAIVTMAYRGKGFYKQKLPLRALASFPSWDRIAFAVSKELKLESLFEIAERKLPLNVSTRSSGVGNTTRYAIDEILSLYGLSFASIKQRGRKSRRVPPADVRPADREHQNRQDQCGFRRGSTHLAANRSQSRVRGAASGTEDFTAARATGIPKSRAPTR